MLKINDKIQIPLREFNFHFARSSGPGGQNVNKVNTKAYLTWNFESSSSVPESVKDRFRKNFPRRISRRGEVTVISQRYRDQGRNTADCLTRLQEMLRSVATAPKRRKPTRPTKGSNQRRLNEKKAHSQKKSRRRPPEL